MLAGTPAVLFQHVTPTLTGTPAVLRNMRNMRVVLMWTDTPAVFYHSNVVGTLAVFSQMLH